MNISYPEKWREPENLKNFPNSLVDAMIFRDNKKEFNLGPDFDSERDIKKESAEEKENRKEEGRCMHCGEITSDKHQFCDSVEQDEEGKDICRSHYTDWCCDECFDDMQNSAA